MKDRVEAQRRQKETYDKGSKVYECSKFTVGKPVLLSIPRTGVNSKLEDRWEGGWRVIVVMGRCYTEESYDWDLLNKLFVRIVYIIWYEDLAA